MNLINLSINLIFSVCNLRDLCFRMSIGSFVWLRMRMTNAACSAGAAAAPQRGERESWATVFRLSCWFPFLCCTTCTPNSSPLFAIVHTHTLLLHLLLFPWPSLLPFPTFIISRSLPLLVCRLQASVVKKRTSQQILFPVFSLPFLPFSSIPWIILEFLSFICTRFQHWPPRSPPSPSSETTTNTTVITDPILFHRIVIIFSSCKCPCVCACVCLCVCYHLFFVFFFLSTGHLFKSF